jgi:hypothetical protein
MKGLICKISKPTANGSNVSSAAILSKEFETKGKTANFTSRRGNCSKIVNLQFLGKNSYATNKRIYFDYDQILSTHSIQGIEIIGTAQQTAAGTSPGTDIPQSEFAKGFIVLVDHCDNEITTMPLTSLCKALNGNKLTFMNLQNINWAACYVRFTNAASISAANTLVLNIYYNKF